MAKRASLSKSFVWIILALLILGLAGFGATNLSGTIRTVGHVGDKYIDVQDYGRALQQELRAFEAQTGQSMTFQQAQAFGLDRTVLSRLVTTRALDNEASQLGLSVGDEILREQIVQIPAFQGPDGNFDREGYRFVIEQQGMTEAQFEDTLRDETARTMLQASMVTGVSMPDAFSDVLLTYIGQRRSFSWSLIGRSHLSVPLPFASEEELEAHYSSNADRFMLPEAKEISYALLTPDMVLDQVEVDETALRQLYEERSAEFNQPERRLVERLVFSNEAEATEAMAALEVGGTTFEALVVDRGLTLGDVDMGDVSQNDLADAGEVVFAASVGEVVGPESSPLGQALFRVNGVLAATNTSFEEARSELHETLATDRARRLIELQANSIDDLLAGGATLEEVAAETDMVFGSIEWFAGLDQGIAAYGDFNDAAAEVSESDFPQVTGLDDGGIFAMRLDNVLPSRPAPMDDIRRDIIADWESEKLMALLKVQSTDALSLVQNGAAFSEAGLTATNEENLIRSDFVEGTPPDFMVQVFEMEAGDVRAVDSEDAVLIVQLNEILPPDDSEEMDALRLGLRQRTDQALAQDIFDLFAGDVQLRGKPEIDQRAVNAVNAGFQ